MLKRFKKWMSRRRVAFDAPPDGKARRGTAKVVGPGLKVDDGRSRHANSEHSRGSRCVPGVTITETVKFELPIEPPLSTPERQHILHPILEEDLNSQTDHKEHADSAKELTPTHSERGEPNSSTESVCLPNGNRQPSPIGYRDVGTEISRSNVTSMEEFKTPAAEFPEVDFGTGLDSDAIVPLDEAYPLDGEAPQAASHSERTSLLVPSIRRKTSNIPRRQLSKKTNSPPTPSSSNASSLIAQDEAKAPYDDPNHVAPPPPPAADGPTELSSAPAPCVVDGTWLIPISISVMPSPSSFEYQFGGLLGEGGFGKVMLALHLHSHTQYAMKVIQLKRIRGYREALSVANEIKVLQTIHHAGDLEMPFLARPAPIRDWIWQFQGNAHIVMVRVCTYFMYVASVLRFIGLLSRWGPRTWAGRASRAARPNKV